MLYENVIMKIRRYSGESEVYMITDMNNKWIEVGDVLFNVNAGGEVEVMHIYDDGIQAYDNDLDQTVFISLRDIRDHYEV